VQVGKPMARRTVLPAGLIRASRSGWRRLTGWRTPLAGLLVVHREPLLEVGAPAPVPWSRTPAQCLADACRILPAPTSCPIDPKRVQEVALPDREEPYSRSGAI